MSADLTKMQRDFAAYYVAGGGRNASAAARVAGYSPPSAAVSASRLLHDPAVLDEIRRLVDTTLRGAIAEAATTLVELTRAGRVKEDAIRLRACESVLDRGGMLLAKYSVAEHRDENPAAIVQEIRFMLRDLGITATVPEKVALERLGIVDADYSVIRNPIDAATAEIEAAPTRAGLEDLI